MKANRLALTTTIALSSLFLLSANAFAKDKTTDSKAARKEDTSKSDKHASIKDRLAKIAEDLKLTDEQKEKLKPIFKDEVHKLMELKKDSSTDRKEKASKLREVMEDTNAKVKPVLTADQLEKWEKIKNDTLHKRRNKK